jgi:hypothetical protein
LSINNHTDDVSGNKGPRGGAGDEAFRPFVLARVVVLFLSTADAAN